MPTRPTTPDPSGQPGGHTPFSGLGAGLDFFQDWLKAAGSALPNLQSQPATGGHMGAWALPTLDPDELDKRIQDLKTVQFWLEQNARMIAMTIQGLEVQKATLSTLQGMNVSMDALRDALKARAPQPEPEPEPAAASAPAEEPSPAASPAASPAGPHGPAAADQPGPDLINPMRWWDTLTQQFTHLATQTAQTAQSVGEAMSRPGAQASGGPVGTQAPGSGGDASKAAREPARKATRRSTARPASKPARKT